MFKLSTPLQFTVTNVIMNNYKGPFADLINTCLLITKQYIYACKCLNLPLSFVNLVQKFYDMQNYERIIALRNNKMYRFNLKWSALK